MSLSLSCTLCAALARPAKDMKRRSRPPSLCDGRPFRASSPPLLQSVSLQKLLSFLLSTVSGENQRSVGSLMPLKPEPWRYVELICETCSKLKARRWRLFLCVKTIRSCTMAGMPAIHYLTQAYLVSHRIHIRCLLFYFLKLLYYLGWV